MFRALTVVFVALGLLACSDRGSQTDPTQAKVEAGSQAQAEAGSKAAAAGAPPTPAHANHAGGHPAPAPAPAAPSIRPATPAAGQAHGAPPPGTSRPVKVTVGPGAKAPPKAPLVDPKATCEQMREQFERTKPSAAKGCKSDDQCEIARYGCPFGCNTPVLKGNPDVGKLATIQKAFRGAGCRKCAYRCLPATARCEAGVCVADVAKSAGG